MESYQERVITEQKELAEKIVKLTSFITEQEKVSLVDAFEWDYLCRQLEVMIEYNRILIIRIAKFKKEALQ